MASKFSRSLVKGTAIDHYRAASIISVEGLGLTPKDHARLIRPLIQGNEAAK